MGIHLVIKEGRAFLPWEQQGQSLQGGEGKEHLETGPCLHQAQQDRAFWAPLGARPSQPANYWNHRQISLPGSTQIHLGFPQGEAQDKWH